MEFVIDRSKWRCGGDGLDTKRGRGETKLLNDRGSMCCLGQIALQLGLKRKDIFDVADPEDLADNDICAPRLLQRGSTNSSLANQAIDINDYEFSTDDERESRLRRLFSKFKHKLTFKGKYVN